MSRKSAECAPRQAFDMEKITMAKMYDKQTVVVTDDDGEAEIKDPVVIKDTITGKPVIAIDLSWLKEQQGNKWGRDTLTMVNRC